MFRLYCKNNKNTRQKNNEINKISKEIAFKVQ